MLALEDQFVIGAISPMLDKANGQGRIQFTNDVRQFQVDVDPDSGTVTVVPQLGDIDLASGTRQSLTAYTNALQRATFRKQWADRSRMNLNSLGSYTPQTTATRSGLSFELPGLLPKRVQSLLGPGSPALNVSGSENIRLAGESNWTNQQIGPLGQKRSLFPSLDMQQDLDIRLEGQLSDRIRVNLLQNSLNQIPLANRIAINYKGEEDDLIQELDLGNTNLSLPGTQYVSYSGRNEGLFGVKASSRMGPLDMTILASKQEGRSERASYAGGASRQAYTIYGHEYVRGVYFLLYDPDQALKTSQVTVNGQLVGALDVPTNTIKVYRDDGNYQNTTEITLRGRAFIDPEKYLGSRDSVSADTLDKPSLHGNFRQLIQGPDQDYVILQSIYGPQWKVLKVRQPLNYDQRLAVSYQAEKLQPTPPPFVRTGVVTNVGGDTLAASDGGRELRLKLIRPPLTELARTQTGDFIDTVGFTRLRHLELENFYQLPGQRIDATSLQLSIKRGDDEPPKTSITESGSIPYIEVLGLDNFDETTGKPVLGHDGRLDGTGVNDISLGQAELWVDYENGVLHFFEPRPFAPRRQQSSFERVLASLLNRRDTLYAESGGTSEEKQQNPIIYDRYNPERKDDIYRIVVDFTAQSVAGDIQLGRGNIIEGSEVVTVNGRSWLRDVDYTIDYDLGRITLKKQLGPADNLNIDYSYAPLFQQAGRTLVGSAFTLDGGNKSLAGAFMYESRGAQDLRPRLGEEPSRSLIGDLSGKWNFTPDWITRMVDWLPGVRTTSPSEFNIEAEAGASFPNPNTRNEVFIDDMEGVRDAVSLSMGAERWKWSSEPSVKDGAVVTPVDSLQGSHDAEIHWYSPFAVVKERDLKPTLKDAEGAQNNRQVLAISIPRPPTPRPPGQFAPGDSMWAGINYVLDQSGIDISKSQFIELWVNDFNDYHTGSKQTRVRGDHVRLHIDVGVVSEDQQRSPDELPNHVLDSEDKPPRDNQLVVTDANNEDTGYDGVLDPLEGDSLRTPLDLTTASTADPDGDDFVKPVDGLEEIDTRRFRGTNGTEGNKVIFPYPDTEDLNLNNALDTSENYFEYTIDLNASDTTYVVTDVQRDFGPGSKYGLAIPPDNGWRRYRIPIEDKNRVAFGIPDLALARHVRVWIDGLHNTDDTTPTAKVIRPLLELGSLEIVGSRWRALDLPDSLVNLGTTVTLNSVNTTDNADIYQAPFNPGETRSGNQQVTRREQSLALEFTNLLPGMELEAFKALSIEEDYTRYKDLGWYAAAFDVPDPDTDSLYYFVRFASDETGQSYYEYSARVPSPTPPLVFPINWRQVILKLTDLSNLKLAVNPGSPVDTIVGAGPNPGDTLKVVGHPSFTRLRRIAFGLLNKSNRTFSQGQLWFNELRATDVEKTMGRAQRLQVSGKLANLLDYSASYSGRDANFISVGETRGVGSSNDNLTFNTSFQPHRFFEGTGIVLPISFGYAQNSSKPRFTAGDDVVRFGAFAQASESRADNRNMSVSYSRNWSERSNPLLRYTLGGLTAGASQQVAHSRNASTVDTSTTMNAYLNYRQSFRSLLPIPVPLFKKARIFPLPDQLIWAYNLATRENHTYDRLRDSTASLVLRNKTYGRAASLTLGTDFRPIDILTYHIDALRNLSLDPAVSQHAGKINLGRNVSLRQNTNASYTLNRGPFLRPALTWGTNYTQDNGPQISSDLSVRQVSSGQNYGLRWELPFETAMGRLGGSAGGARDTTRRRFSLRQWVSRIGNVSADASFDRGSSYSRLLGSPGFAYLFGFSEDPGLGGSRPRTREAFGDQIGKSQNWRAAGRTKVNLGFGASASTQLEFTSRETENNGVQQRNDANKFPDLTFEYGKVTDLIQLSRFMVNPSLRTAYNRNTQTLYQDNSNNPTSISTASQWQPLLSLNGGLKNGSTIQLGVERRNTQRENFISGHSISNERQTTVNFSFNRQYTQGQKVTFLGKSSTVRSSINMGASANYERRSGETKFFGGDAGLRNPTNEDRLNVQGNGSYGFSTNVTGTATLGFQQSRDLQRAIVRRSIRVELRGSFTF